MEESWRLQSCFFSVLVLCHLFLLNLSFCCSINHEGVALLRFKEKLESDPYGALTSWRDEVGLETPCSWVGVGCSEGRVIVLNLKDLRLRGSLAPDVANMAHLKYIILRNNSFSGVIPEEISSLKELQVLDLGYNNFSGPLPCHLDSDNLKGILILDNNELLDETRPESFIVRRESEVQAEDNEIYSVAQTSCNGLLISRNPWDTEDVTHRKLLQESPRKIPTWTFALPPPPPPPPPSPSPPDVVSSFRSPPTFLPSSPDPVPPPPPPSPPSSELVPPPLSPSPNTRFSPPSPPTPTESAKAPSKSWIEQKHFQIPIFVTGGLLMLLALISVVLFCRGKMATVSPWSTGLSGQLQRALVTGVRKLKRSELVVACEDFSNVIGSSSGFTMYKGTLSSGVEIAVVSIGIKSAKDWERSLEARFMKKIDTLSKANHKNFVCLLGYCAEKEPFTRMMVFEYAPNGTLFEHLHIREAEHLDWAMRLRIAMGIAYCLEHLHQLTPALTHRNLTSSSVYLTEDYAGKLSDFIYTDEGSSAQAEPHSNVYSFGVLLFEMLTGRLPYSVGSEPPENWAAHYLRVQPLREIVDPTLRRYDEDQLRLMENVIKVCTCPDPRLRPSMNTVCVELREITRIGPDGAVPRVSPLWWAELEILSTEAN